MGFLLNSQVSTNQTAARKVLGRASSILKLNTHVAVINGLAHYLKTFIDINSDINLYLYGVVIDKKY